MDCTAPSPPSVLCTQMAKNDHILDMSPRPSRHLNPSSAELVKEIAMLEVEIEHLERYLLSLYRNAFQQHLPRILGKHENHVEVLIGKDPWVISDQTSPETESEMSKDFNAHQGQTSRTSALGGPNDLVQVAIRKSSSERERRSAYSCHRRLADHFVNSPDKLSEDIVRCMASIYCKLASNERSQKGFSVLSASSFCSSTTFSGGTLSSSWSNDGATEHCEFEGIKQDDEPCTAMVEVLKICLDDESYSYAATMLQKFRSLVKSLEIIDLKKMRREEMLAFWINIHNALVMHAYLAYGTQNHIKGTSIVKAAYNVGGHSVNAYDIQSQILGIKSHYSAPWHQTFLSSGKKFKTGTTKHAYAIEYPEPLVHFALCSGAYSDPAVRVYTAKSVFQDLKVAKEEFIQATVYVHKQTKIYLPKILQYYAKDMSFGMAALLEVVGGCLSENQQNAIRKFVKDRPEKNVYWLEQNLSFRYLIHKETVERISWGA